ncbi:ester cyclase [Bosea vaviloviae]|uniref:Ester cyclase n=1 Tax=Bosea vaviloviae TaxID=1526658 RepID=A0A0N1F1F0_9HYPH|nr:ester cyclase [Bosea vaviloviae]KPH77491.1 ester cyclase [Bosea vaviloviae]
MSDPGNTFMRRFVQFINTADEMLGEELIAPNAEFYVPFQSDPLIGPPGWLAAINVMRGGFPDVQWTLEELVVEGEKIAARYTMRGTHEGVFFGVPATRRQITVQTMNFYVMANGKIVGERGQPDLLGLMQQIGAVPAPS